MFCSCVHDQGRAASLSTHRMSTTGDARRMGINRRVSICRSLEALGRVRHAYVALFCVRSMDVSGVTKVAKYPMKAIGSRLSETGSGLTVCLGRGNCSKGE